MRSRVTPSTPGVLHAAVAAARARARLAVRDPWVATHDSLLARRLARPASAAIVLAVGLLACAGSRGERTAAAPSAAHPEVDTGIETCASCHAQATPEVARAFSQGKHGLALVECVVCHGSTGADFRARPGVTSCGSCHAAEVASVSRGGAAPSCFSCHPPHSLAPQGKKSPHGGRP